MLPFRLQLEDGLPVSEQLVRAAKRAILGGELEGGEIFPSVRMVAQELRVSPTTVHKARLSGRGREALEDVLAAEPWSKASWEKVVRPYLVEVSEEGDLPRLLDLLDLNPWMADLFLEKGWSKEAEPVLRKHLADGKTLTKRTVIYLAALDEEELGDDLVNQLLRMSGDFDAVAEAVKGHPGVVWGEVRSEAWKRMVTGFGSHHVWAQWGVEMGEKEALRRFLVEAIRGRDWEREKLEEWFGKNEDVVGMLRRNWERVVFREGKWVVDTALGS